MGTTMCYSCVQAAEKPICQVSKKLGLIQEGKIPIQNFKRLITHIFWLKNHQEDIVIGIHLDDDKFIQYIYLYSKNSEGYEQKREKPKEFSERSIPVQKAEKLKVKKTQNDFQSLYQQENDPKHLIKMCVNCQIEFEDYSNDFDLNDGRGNYTVCYQNYLMPDELIFQNQETNVYYTFDFKRTKIKKENKQFLYKYGIKLKNPPQNEDEILILCKKYEKVDKFLETEKL